jgi:N-acetyl-gamma-glutamyl-phosphate reductase
MMAVPVPSTGPSPIPNGQSVPIVGLRLAVVGATGFAGQELVRLLARHPSATLAVAMSSASSTAPRPLPALARIWDNPVVPFDVVQIIETSDIAFLAVPETAAAALGPVLLRSGIRVIDLSGAFRLRDDAQRTRWYPTTSSVPDGVVYALPERHRATIRDARLLSCPGCYPTAALLALAPLAEAGLLREPIVVDAKSGISGAGKTPTERTHFSENHGSVAGYSVFSHRHTPEIEQELGAAVTFVPHLVPLDRGILETIYAFLEPGTTDAQVASVLRAAYAEAPFVRLTGGVLPEIKHVAHTNFCDIGWKVDEHTNRIVMIACLDNLIKGAAGQAVQNFNIALGLDERMGLL